MSFLPKAPKKGQSLMSTKPRLFGSQLMKRKDQDGMKVSNISLIRFYNFSQWVGRWKGQNNASAINKLELPSNGLLCMVGMLQGDFLFTLSWDVLLICWNVGLLVLCFAKKMFWICSRGIPGNGLFCGSFGRWIQQRICPAHSSQSQRQHQGNFHFDMLVIKLAWTA